MQASPEAKVYPTLQSPFCGSGLARDGITVIHLIDRSVCIAGKPAPTTMRLQINLRQGIKFQISQRLHLVFTHPLVRGIRANRFIREQAHSHYSPSHPPAFHRQNKFANLFFYPLLPEALTSHTFYYPALNMGIYVPQKKRCFIYETDHKTQ